MPVCRLLGLLALSLLQGCTMFPSWMHPANLWKLNGQEPMGRESQYFSIPDPPRADRPPEPRFRDLPLPAESSQEGGSADSLQN